MFTGWLTFYCFILIFLWGTDVSAKSLGALLGAEELDLLRNTNMGEFIKLLGIPHEGLCHASEDDDGIEPMLNSELPFGDLLMEEEDEDDEDVEIDTNDIAQDFESDGSKEEGKSTKTSKTKWKNGIIPYYISSNDFSQRQKETIENAISLMNSSLKRVKFRPYNRFQDENYIHIFSGKGCYAKLGMVGGAQPVSLQADKCLKTGIVQHELMHVTGFSHEQNRPDREDYIEILFYNIPDKWLNEYKRKNPKDAAFVGNYDYYSVMHYPTESPGDPDKDALELLDRSVNKKDVGNRPSLSQKDIEKIDIYYN